MRVTEDSPLPSPPPPPGGQSLRGHAPSLMRVNTRNRNISKLTRGISSVPFSFAQDSIKTVSKKFAQL